MPDNQPGLFDGRTYDPAHDEQRLKSQLGRVYNLMCDGGWRTLAEIHEEVGGSQPGVSARLRDLRKEKFGAYQVLRRRRYDPSSGLFEYQLKTDGFGMPVKGE